MDEFDELRQWQKEAAAADRKRAARWKAFWRRLAFWRWRKS